MYLIDSPHSPDLATLTLAFESLTVIQAGDLANIAPQQIVLADVDAFLTQRWSHPNKEEIEGKR